MSPRSATKPLKRAVGTRTTRTSVPPVDTTVRRAPRPVPLKRAVPATATKKGESVSAPVKSPFSSMKVYKADAFREEPKTVDPKVWEFITHVKANGPSTVDIDGWSTEDIKLWNDSLAAAKTHPEFEGARFYHKRGQLADTGHAAWLVRLSFPGTTEE